VADDGVAEDMAESVTANEDGLREPDFARVTQCVTFRKSLRGEGLTRFDWSF
jgi:hypothetical protein